MWYTTSYRICMIPFSNGWPGRIFTFFSHSSPHLMGNKKKSKCFLCIIISVVIWWWWYNQRKACSKNACYPIYNKWLLLLLLLVVNLMLDSDKNVNSTKMRDRCSCYKRHKNVEKTNKRISNWHCFLLARQPQSKYKTCKVVTVRFSFFLRIEIE